MLTYEVVQVSNVGQALSPANSTVAISPRLLSQAAYFTRVTSSLAVIVSSPI